MTRTATGDPSRVRREFSAAAKERVSWLFTRYPVKEAALLPVLRLAEEEFGQVDAGAVELVAETINVSPSYVYGVLTFYTHFRRAGDGRFVVQICATLPCALRGCRDIVAHLERRLGIQAGETTPDGRFTLRKVECLGSCDTAPVLQINSEPYCEKLTPDSVDALLNELRSKP